MEEDHGGHEELHQLDEDEFNLMLYLATRGEAREVLDILEVEDIVDADVAVLWDLLDDAFDYWDFEKYDDASLAYEGWSRTPGMSMNHYIQGLKKKKILLMGQDPDLHISEKAFTSRLIFFFFVTVKYVI